MPEPRVWIGCLACYNAGRLVGKWVDAIEAGDKTPGDIHDNATTLLSLESRDGGSPHEELWCMDHENFGGLLTGECSPTTAQEIAEVIEKLYEEMPGYEQDELLEAFAGWRDWSGADIEEAAIEHFQEQFAGIWDSEADYAADFAESTGAFSIEVGYHNERRDVSDQWPFNCIDWEQAARDLDLSSHELSNYKLAIYTIN